MKGISMITILTLISLILFGCGGEDAPKEQLQEAVSVKTIVATTQPLPNQLSYSGSVEPIERVNIATKIMAGVEEIYFEEGEKVTKGAVVVKLRSQDLEAKRAQADAAIIEAKAHFNNVETNLHRIQSLYEGQAATQKELDDMKTVFVGAQARKRAGEEMKKEVEELLTYTALRAPFAGIVTKKSLEQGDLANPGQPILTIENIDKLKIVVAVPESEVQTLKPGMPVHVSIQASGVDTNGKAERHVIDKIVPSADRRSRQFEIHVIIDNPGGLIKPGMFARVATAESTAMTLLVPKTSVFRRGQLLGIYIVDSENKAHLRWISTGGEVGGSVEVLSGLSPGERVVIKSASQLSDGKTVEVSQ